MSLVMNQKPKPSVLLRVHMATFPFSPLLHEVKLYQYDSVDLHRIHEGIF
jgi:hypothetical protein